MLSGIEKIFPNQLLIGKIRYTVVYHLNPFNHKNPGIDKNHQVLGKNDNRQWQIRYW